MKMSESIDKIAPALLKAQRKIGAALKDSKNPFFKSSYSDLGSVMEACKQAYNEEGIAVLQPAFGDSTGHYVETFFLHESGQWMTDNGKLLELQKPTMQELGSAETYGRRYGLQAMGFIPSTDDDAETTMKRNSPVPPSNAPGPEKKTSSFRKPKDTIATPSTPQPTTQVEQSNSDEGEWK